MKWNSLATMIVFAHGCRCLGRDRAKILPIVRTLEGTARLEMQGDIASQLVDGADRFLPRPNWEVRRRPRRFWKRDFRSAQQYQFSLNADNRERLAHILGDPRYAQVVRCLELLGHHRRPALVGEGTGFRAYAVRWPAFADVRGEGLLLAPTGATRAEVIALPDAGQTPEMITGLAEGVPPESQFARRLAESGCRVLVPVLIDRQMMEPRPGTKITHREYIYRSAFELGRHVIGYELQKVLAAVDYLGRNRPADASRDEDRRDRLGRRRNAGPGGRRARPANRRRLRERLLQRPGERLAGTARPQRFRAAGTVRRRGAGDHDRAAGAHRRGGPGSPRW